MIHRLALPVLAGCLWPAVASAVNTYGHEIPYVTAGGLYEYPDSDRDSDEGYGFHAGFGYPLDWNGQALELTVARLQRDRDIDGKKDYQTSVFLNWVSDLASGSGGVAYALLGIGGVRDDVRGDEHDHFGFNGGVGGLFDTGWYGWAVRAEVLAQAQLNDESVPGDDYLIDYQFRLGLELPLSFLFKTPEPEAAPECPVRVVDLRTGRSDCDADSDGDAVDDTLDQCPGTSIGSVVDASGCTPQ